MHLIAMTRQSKLDRPHGCGKKSNFYKTLLVTAEYRNIMQQLSYDHLEVKTYHSKVPNYSPKVYRHFEVTHYSPVTSSIRSVTLKGRQLSCTEAP